MKYVVILSMIVLSLTSYMYMTLTRIQDNQQRFGQSMWSDVIFVAGLLCTMILYGTLMVQVLK